MIKAFYLALLLIAPVVLSQRYGGHGGHGGNGGNGDNGDNGGNGGNGGQGYNVPQNWVDNTPPSCGNVPSLIISANNNLATVISRISGIRSALTQLPRQLQILSNYCSTRFPYASTRRKIQRLIRQVDNLAQPLIDDPVQAAQFDLDQFNNDWSGNTIAFVCWNVYYDLQALIQYFQWLAPALQSYYINAGGVLPLRLAALNSYQNTCMCPGNPGLCIIGAAWGTGDVTSLVKSIAIGQQGLSLIAQENPLPTGNKPNGYARSLVVIYQQGNNKPQVAIAAEGSTLTISPNGSGQPWNGPVAGQLNIFGAAWGLADVTSILAAQVSRGQLTVNPSVNSFKDSWPNQQKTLVISYQGVSGVKLVDYLEVYDNTSYTIY